MTLSNVKVILYVVYISDEETPMYYKGSTFYNVSEWSANISDAFYFNHEPRPYEMTEILENTNWNDVGINDIKIKPLSGELTQIEE